MALSTPPAAPAFVAVDWGTSSLRIWLLDGQGTILAEHRSAEGMEAVASSAFEATLRVRLGSFGEALRSLPEPWPIVLCGMVGARQGWRQAPYLSLPAPLFSLAESASMIAALGMEARILPGLARRNPEKPDVMRGEETQLLGLLLREREFSGLVAMPGTHAKWAHIRQGTVTDFTTFMTGELYALLSKESILRHSLRGEAPRGDPQNASFRQGLTRALADGGLDSAALFALRAGDLLFGSEGKSPADYLSGLLIGAEIAAAQKAFGPLRTVTVVAGSSLGALYKAAIETAGGVVRIIDADQAVRAGLSCAARHFWPHLFPQEKVLP